MKVKAAVVRASGAPLRIEALELAEPGPRDILVRLVAVGVGRVDRAAISGALEMPLPFVPGSEGAGFVERVGTDVAGLEPGDPVLIDYAACGTCEPCRADHPRACTDFTAQNLRGRRTGEVPPFKSVEGEVNGFFFGQSSFATHVVCRADHAVKLPKEMPLEIAAAFGGEGLLGFAAVVEAFRLERGNVLAIAGAGLVGLVACQVAKARGAGAIVIAEPDADRRSLAAACGATVAVHSDADLATAVQSLAGNGADFALDTTGYPSGRAACRASLRPGGTMGLTQPVASEEETDVIAIDRLLMPHALIPDLVALYLAGRVTMDRLITFFPLAEVNMALAATGVVKAVLRVPLGAFDDLDYARSGGGVTEVPEPSPTPTEEESESAESEPAAPVMP